MSKSEVIVTKTLIVLLISTSQASEQIPYYVHYLLYIKTV